VADAWLNFLLSIENRCSFHISCSMSVIFCGVDAILAIACLQITRLKMSLLACHRLSSA
jgi:hypothetical protein